MQLNLDLEKAIYEINKSDAKRICIQLPDGLKPKANIIQEQIKQKTKAKEIFFWFGSCFGACDIPKIDHLNFDLLITFGHSPFIKQ